MVKTGLKIYKNNIWHFFTILGFVALGLIIALSIMIPAMRTTINQTTNDLAAAGKLIAADKFNVDKFFASLGDQFKAFNWSNPLDTIKEIFTQNKLISILSIAVTHAGIDLNAYPQFQNMIKESATTIINSSISQLAILITCIAICAVAGYIFIRTMIHFKTTSNRNPIRYIINLCINILFLVLISYLFVITVQHLNGVGMWFALIAITIFQILGELTISFLSFAQKDVKFKDIVNFRSVLSSLITSFIIVVLSFAIVAIIYPFNSLAAILVGIPLLIVTSIIMDSVTNAFVNNFSKKV